MPSKKRFSLIKAKLIGDALGIDWHAFGIKQFRIGLEVEHEHGSHEMQPNVSDNDAMITGKFAMTHLNEYPDYYTHLLAMEKEADDYWANV